MQKLIFWFDEIGMKDVPLVGGKNASLGEMYRKLSQKGVKVPNGFAITAPAYFYFMDHAGIQSDVKTILSNLDIEFEFVVGADEICRPCTHLGADSRCDDVLHQLDSPISKQEYNVLKATIHTQEHPKSEDAELCVLTTIGRGDGVL